MKLRHSILVIAALTALMACKGERATVTGGYGASVVAGQVAVTGMEDNSPAGVQVSVRGAGMATTLAPDGLFQFANVPENVVLVFHRADGIDTTYTVEPNSGFLNISLSKGSSSRRRSAAGGTPARVAKEYEGLVRSASATELVVFTSHQEEVTFVINAATVIRHGNKPVAPEDLKAGDRVHVKATTAEDGTKTATLVLVQNTGEDDGEGDDEHAAKEYEGTVRSASATELVIFDSHRQEVTFVLNAATVIRKGNTPVNATDLKEGDRVHVKATTATDGTKTAVEVIVQNTKH